MRRKKITVKKCSDLPQIEKTGNDCAAGSPIVIPFDLFVLPKIAKAKDKVTGKTYQKCPWRHFTDSVKALK